ncbi:hypothetical protein, partial [Raoultella ornithinolytica]|uniref:hypothetical protein n=1 Tax=Raoultella ornithinolytica TaxID=54291 RepID=UPI001954F8DE
LILIAIAFETETYGLVVYAAVIYCPGQLPADPAVAMVRPTAAYAAEKRSARIGSNLCGLNNHNLSPDPD